MAIYLLKIITLADKSTTTKIKVLPKRLLIYILLSIISNLRHLNGRNRVQNQNRPIGLMKSEFNLKHSLISLESAYRLR